MKKEEVALLQDLIDISIKKIINYYSRDIEIYEKEDMKKYLKEYPELKVIDYKIMLYLQRWYNDERLSAGWCGCTRPENLIEFLKSDFERNNPALKGFFETINFFSNKIMFNNFRELGHGNRSEGQSRHN